MEPFLILDSSNVTVKNVIIDYWRPYYTEGVVTSAGYFTTFFHINTALFPFHVEMLTFVFEHEGFNLGVKCGFGRYYSSSADATHFSNCKGKIVVENTNFEGMMDDAINVHSTSLKIIEIVNNSCVKLQYVHSQSVGFETFLPGEKNSIHSFKKTLENEEIRVVTNAEKLSTNELLAVFEGSIPSSIGVGDAVENGDFYSF